MLTRFCDGGFDDDATQMVIVVERQPGGKRGRLYGGGFVWIRLGIQLDFVRD